MGAGANTADIPDTRKTQKLKAENTEFCDFFLLLQHQIESLDTKTNAEGKKRMQTKVAAKRREKLCVCGGGAILKLPCHHTHIKNNKKSSFQFVTWLGLCRCGVGGGGSTDSRNKYHIMEARGAS